MYELEEDSNDFYYKIAIYDIIADIARLSSGSALQDVSRNKFFDSLRKSRENLVKIISPFTTEEKEKPVNKVTDSDKNGLVALDLMQKPFKSLNELVDLMNNKKVTKE